MKKLFASFWILALFSQTTMPIAAQAGADLFNHSESTESVAQTETESQTESTTSQVTESEEDSESTPNSESLESTVTESEASAETSTESTTEDTESAETTTDSNQNFLSEDLITLFEENLQDNKKLDIAWEDYQQVADYTFYDLTVMDPTGVTTYDEVLENFETSEEVVVNDEFYEDNLSVISFLYQAEQGDVHPERGIEDWAQIEFYFAGDLLIYSGVSTMSFEFADHNKTAVEDIDALSQATDEVAELATLEPFEINGIGQVLADGQIHHGLAFPITPLSEADPIGSVAVLAVDDDTLLSSFTAGSQDVMTYSYTTVLFMGLTNIVPNNLVTF